MNELKSLFSSVFPELSFDKIYNHYSSEHDKQYSELLEDFNNGEYYSENSKCTIENHYIGHEVSLETAISLSESEVDFEIIVEGEIFIKRKTTYEFLPDIQTPEEVIAAMIESYIHSKSPIEIPPYTECNVIKFDTSSIKRNTKHSYSKHFIEHTLKERFESKFKSHSYIGVINALYDKANDDVKQLSDDFDNGIFNYKNSSYITKSIQVDSIDKAKLKSIIEKYGKFKLVSCDNEMYINYNTVEKNIKHPSEVAVIGIQQMLYKFDERDRTIKRIESKLNKIG